jgi:uncharacterized protein
MTDVSAVREELEFDSHGTPCAAWLYRPPAGGAAGPAPVVVLCHGLGAVRGMRLAAYAERFSAAGYLALVFDYRHFGASGGTPRELLDIARQREDLAAALAFARSLPGADPDRAVAWGTSFGGGHVLAVAARDRRLAAAVAQCPFTDGPASALALGPRSGLKVGALGLRDVLAARRGREPVRVAVAGPPGSAALMSAPDAEPGYLRLGEGAGVTNAVAARVGLRIPWDRPGRHAARVACPVLFCVCDRDSVAPARATLRHAARAPRGEVLRYPAGHFDIYLGAPFELAVADQLAFLRHHVPAPRPGG